MASTATRRREPVTLYTPKEAADHLGCSEMHVYRLIAAGHLSAVDIAINPSRSKTRIRGDDLADYIDRKTRGRTAVTTG